MSFKFCSLSSGSSGNCYLISSNKTYLLVDAGISCKKIVEGLSMLDINPLQLSGVMITHEHIDHIKGAEVLSRKYNIPIYSNEKTGIAMVRQMKKADSVSVYSFENNRPFSVGDIEVHPFPVSHDSVDAVGFSFYLGNGQISTATDTGCITPEIMAEISNADLLVLEANHDEDMLKMGHYPWPLKKRILSNFGHLSNEAAGQAISDMLKYNPKQRQILLAHLSKENNFPEMAFETIKNVLEENGQFIGNQFQLNLLHRDALSPIYII